VFCQPRGATRRAKNRGLERGSLARVCGHAGGRKILPIVPPLPNRYNHVDFSQNSGCELRKTEVGEPDGRGLPQSADDERSRGRKGGVSGGAETGGVASMGKCVTVHVPEFGRVSQELLSQIRCDSGETYCVAQRFRVEWRFGDLTAGKFLYSCVRLGFLGCSSFGEVLVRGYGVWRKWRYPKWRSQDAPMWVRVRC
jgi:hypothetical protein